MDSNVGVTRGFATLLEIAGVLVVAWGMLLLLTFGLTVIGVGAWLLFAAYGVAVIHADRRAVILGWMVTGLMGIATIAEGLTPVLMLVWCGFFVLSTFLSDTRDQLRGGTPGTWRITARSR